MSRFENLEFDDQHKGRSSEQPALKDEAFYVAEATAAFENAEFEQALRAYAKVLEFNPANATAWTGQVRMLIELGEFQEAKVWADKALERFPSEAELLAAKAVALGRIGDLKAALAFSDAAIEVRGDTPYVWLSRGDVLLARKEKRANYCFDKALELEPQNWFFHWLVSRVQFYYEKFSLALKHAQQALAMDASRCAAWLQAGQCQMALGLAGPAQNSFEQAIELNPHCQPAHRALDELPRQGFWSRLGGRLRGMFT